jgi:hypothetical protein
MNYQKKYQTLIRVLRKQVDVLDTVKLEPLIQAIDKEIDGKRRTHKQAFFTLLQVYIAFDVIKDEKDRDKRLLDQRLKALDAEGKDLGERAGETPSLPLISEDDDLFVFLYKNAKPLLPEREFHSILNFFLSKSHDAEKEAHKRTNWLLSVALYQKLLQSKEEAGKKRIHRVLLGYLSRKTNNEEIDHVFDKLKELNAYFSLDDVIYYRMVPDKAKKNAEAPHGPYQNTFLDEMRALISSHQSHADLKVIKKYDANFRMHSCRFIEMVKLLYKELTPPEKRRLRDFIRKLTLFDKTVRKYHVMLGLQSGSGGGTGVFKSTISAKNLRLEKKLTEEAEALLKEAHALFDTCMPGTISYHVMAGAFLALGFALVILGVLSLALLPPLAIPVLGAAAFYSLSAATIVTGYGFGLFSAFTLNKARQCVQSSTIVANTAINLIEHCKDSGLTTAKSINFSLRPPKAVLQKEETQEKLEDPTSHSPRIQP